MPRISGSFTSNLCLTFILTTVRPYDRTTVAGRHVCLRVTESRVDENVVFLHPIAVSDSVVRVDCEIEVCSRKTRRVHSERHLCRCHVKLRKAERVRRLVDLRVQAKLFFQFVTSPANAICRSLKTVTANENSVDPSPIRQTCASISKVGGTTGIAGMCVKIIDDILFVVVARLGLVFYG